MSVRTIFGCALMLAVVACGGGGGGGGTTIPIDLGAGFAQAGGADGTVEAIAAAPDGSGDVIAGGAFTSYDTTTVNRIARLDPDGTLD